MNPWLLLAAGVFWVISVGGAYVKGQTTGANRVIAQQVKVDEAIKQTREAAQQGAADAISQIKITNTTIRGRTETVVRENVVYRDCRHAPDGLRNVNVALTGVDAQPAGGGELPKVDASGR